MAKLLVISTISLFFYALTCCSATVYTVGGNSGWDISTDLDSWSSDKTYSVGDTLLFQYSKYHSVSELTKENYERCNTTNALQSSSNGNTTIALSSPGERYFVCGNRLHCLGGMKLHVNVVGNEVQPPAGAPQPQPGGPEFPAGSSRTNNPPNSSHVVKNRIGIDTLVVTFFGVLVMFAVI